MVFLSSVTFIGLRESKTFEDQALAPGSNQKRLLNFYKELAMNLSAVADVTADEPSLRALALLLGLSAGVNLRLLDEAVECRRRRCIETSRISAHFAA